MKIFLVRHGQTTGDCDDRLTGFGQRQAKALAKELISEKIEVIFTSPKICDRETARVLQNELNVEVEIIDDFQIEKLMALRKKAVLAIANDETIQHIYRDLLKIKKIKLEGCSYSVLETDKKGLKLISNKGITQV